MRHPLSVFALLGLAAGVAASQEERKDDTSKIGETCEVRVYLVDKNRKDVDLKDITASLVLEEKGKPTRTIPMVVTTPRGSEKIGSALSGQKMPVVGTDYLAELIVMKKALASVPDPKDRPLDPSEDEREAQPRSSSFFKAELTKDQEPGKDCLTSVHFMIKGEKRIATGFTCSPTGALPQGKADIARTQQELRTLEKAISEHDMDKAKMSAARLCEGLQASAGKEGHQGECREICAELKTAIDAGNRDKALKLVEKCKKKTEDRFKD